MTIDIYLRILKRRWRQLAALTLLGILSAVAVTMLTPRVYSATTTQFVRGVPGAGANADYQAAQFATSRAKSYSALIGNPDLLGGVISQLNLDISAAELLGRLTVDNPPDTVLVNVSARGATPDQAQATSVAAADNLAKLIIRLESAGATGGKSPIDVQTAVPASRPTSPSSPRPVLNLAVGTMIGLALGSILALALETRRPLTSKTRLRPNRSRGPRVDPSDDGAPTRAVESVRGGGPAGGIEPQSAPHRHQTAGTAEPAPERLQAPRVVEDRPDGVLQPVPVREGDA